VLCTTVQEDVIHQTIHSFLLPRQNPVFGKFQTLDSLETDGLWDVYNNFAMGNCGESAAEKYDISRESQDAHAVESYKRAERAWKSGAFDAEIVPIIVKGKKGDTVIREDDEYKRVMFDKIPTLRSAFKQGGTITAANSSPISDGASALILMSAEKAKELGLTPLAKVVCKLLDFITFLVFLSVLSIAWSDAGTDPIDFPIAPTVALPQALKKANLKVEDISLFEINEAFSVVVRIAEKVMNIDPAKINVNGYVDRLIDTVDYSLI
jgi:acetyl-CoA C-acetyltransferase